MIEFIQPFVLLALNDWLSRAGWAKEALAPFVDLNVMIVVTLPGNIKNTFCWCYVAPGRFVAANTDTPATSIYFPEEALSLWFADGNKAIETNMKIEGNLQFARVLSDVLSQYRFEPEVHLSPLIGNVLAMRLTKHSREVANLALQNFSRLFKQLSEFLSFETKVLIPKTEFLDWQSDINMLRDDLARIEKRIALLT